ncbi:MAG: homocysteine S-methyltransferase family protein, partial [Eubacterium sp.]|nr:homocysteine S-methyltransferase family protein [Eubacterium sp.]
MNFRDYLGKKRLVLDGATGSVLQTRGLKAGELPERWNLSHPDEIIGLAESYYRAGSDIVLTNTFGANALKYPEDLKEIVTAAVRNTKTARENVLREMDENGKADRGDLFVALEMGPTGKLLAPMGDLPFEDAVSLFGEVVRYGAEAGADLILIETMNDSYEAKAALLAAKENSDLPVCVSMTYDGSGKLLTGGTVDSTAAMLEGLGADAVGMNCGLGPEQMLPIVKRLLEVSSVPVFVKPNAGLPRVENGKTVYDITPEGFAGWMKQIAELGVHAVGGCCGTTPAHIREMAAACRGIPVSYPEKKHRTVVTSYSQAVVIGDGPVVIGERINPTGKKKYQKALRENDLDFILSQGIEQEKSGAEILDVNVGLPGIDEPAVMERVVTGLQEVTALPLQIDTSDPAALERALRLYNGKAMINSVSGKRES